MNVEEASDAFDSLLEKISDEHKAHFLISLQNRFFVSQCRGHEAADARSTLRNIAEDIRSTLPEFGGVLPSENIVSPSQENSNYDPKHSVFIDSFLYEEMDLCDLEKEGKLQRYYCKDCDSRNIAPLEFLSHSCSTDRLDFIFSSFLPYLDKDKVVLDVGSRLGAMLFGAYVYTEAGAIVGVELNQDWVDVCQRMVNKYKMDDRIKVVCDDILNQSKLVKEADVVILHNVFEFFLLPEQQAQAWEFLRQNTKSGCLLVTVPSLETSLASLKVNFKLNDWVKSKPVTDPLLVMSMESHPDIAPVHIYQVI